MTDENFLWLLARGPLPGTGSPFSEWRALREPTPALNMMGLMNSYRSPFGRRIPNERVYPDTTGSPYLQQADPWT
jgi:hypothetical protein